MGLHEELTAINRLHLAEQNYEKTLALLRHLKAGDVQLFQVRLLEDGWQFDNAAVNTDVPKCCGEGVGMTEVSSSESEVS